MKKKKDAIIINYILYNADAIFVVIGTLLIPVDVTLSSGHIYGQSFL